MSLNDSAFAYGYVCACGACAAADEAFAQNNLTNDPEIVRAEARSSYYAPTTGGDAGLISGRVWADRDISFAFPQSAENYDTDQIMVGVQYGSGEPLAGFLALNSAQVAATEFALSQFSAVSGLTFVQLEANLAGEATLRFGQSDQPATAWGYYPSAADEGGDVWLGRSEGYYTSPERGNYAWHTFLHEIGHTLGLKHGHDGGSFGALPGAEDSMEISVMTYRSFVGDPLIGGYSNDNGSYAQTLMQADISAIQQMYGANYDHLSGNTRYTWDATTGEQFINGAGQGATVDGTVFMTVWDGGGIDTFDFSTHRADLKVDLAPGAATILSDGQLAWLNRFEASSPKILATGSIYTARLFEGDERALIENALGGRGNDAISGNDVRNVISGGQGNDTLSGGGGRDKLSGDAGRDALFGGPGNDILFGRSGADELSGGTGDDRLKGGAWHDRLYGDSGNDSLIGGGGHDSLIGGKDDDVLTGGGGRDRFMFQSGDGTDRITDFEDGRDLIDLSSLGFSFGDVTVLGMGGGARITFENGVLFLEKMKPTQIDESDFVF